MSAVDEHAEAHRLRAEHGWGARRVGEALGISRYAASRLLAQPLPQPVADRVAEVADRVAEVADRVAETVAEVAEPVADRPTATDDQLADRPLPRRVAQPLAGVDLGQWPAVRRDLAVLAQTGRSAEALAHQAITAVAHHYARALAQGLLQPGQEFHISSVVLRPRPAARPAAPAVPGG
ncbi:hypothetical protein [Streptomyces sp. bgisy153]|uniref:hypothetical protein n=1 Tax=Streptomyces sp. bgisy153 TaxID=3413793 RepID=UPI003D7062DA